MRRRGEINPHTGEPEWRSKDWHFLLLPARRDLLSFAGCLFWLAIATTILVRALLAVLR